MTSRRLNLSVQYACNKEGLPLRLVAPGCAPRSTSTVRAAGRSPFAWSMLKKACSSIATTAARTTRPTCCLSRTTSIRWSAAISCCARRSSRAAAEQNKSLIAHYAHLIVHGLLHLQGYDHETGERQAQQMEDRERTMLAALGFTDPYLDEQWDSRRRPSRPTFPHHPIRMDITPDTRPSFFERLSRCCCANPKTASS